jgi:hypothetical protein
MTIEKWKFRTTMKKPRAYSMLFSEEKVSWHAKANDNDNTLAPPEVFDEKGANQRIGGSSALCILSHRSAEWNSLSL